MTDLGKRLANRVQLTTDGRKAYLDAVEGPQLWKISDMAEVLEDWEAAK
jgi:hypothetical protein